MFRFGESCKWVLLGAMLLLLANCQRQIAVIPPPVPAVIDATRLEQADKLAAQQEKHSELPDAQGVMLVLKRTGCFGKCPVFEATVYADGRATYEGIRHVTQLGTYQAVVDSAWWKTVLDKAASANFFALSDRYPENGDPILDLPTTTTTLLAEGKAKTIINNFGSPKSLRDFENWLESAFEMLPWAPAK